MPRFTGSIRRRVLTSIGLCTLTVMAALVVVLPSARAADPVYQELSLPGVCNDASLEIAKAIDAKLQNDQNPLRMIQNNQPKQGESGYHDATVIRAYILFAAAINKNVGELTAADVTAAGNANKLADAVKDALAWRKDIVDKGGTTILTSKDNKDKGGNQIYLWCLKPVRGVHGGPDLGLLYVPKNAQVANGVWIAACVLPGGLNAYYYSVDGDGVFNSFKWINQGPDPNNKPNGVIRYTFVYTPGTGKLSVTREYGTYTDGKFEATKTEKGDPYDAPSEFKNLKLKDEQISMSDGSCDCPGRVTLVATASPNATDLADLGNPPLDGDGSLARPFVGISTTLTPGESLVFQAPAGTVVVGDGPNPQWTVVQPDGSSVATVRYDGQDQIEVAVGAVISDVAVTAPAPSPSVPPVPSGTPTPTASPGPTGPPSATPPVTGSPSPAPSVTTTAIQLCHLTYSVMDWGSGFTANLVLTNRSASTITGWTLRFAFSGDQRITAGWSGSYVQSGQQVTVTNAAFNGTLPPNTSTSFGFSATYTGTNVPPASFSLNDLPCG